MIVEAGFYKEVIPTGFGNGLGTARIIPTGLGIAGFRPRSAAVPGCEFAHRPGACSNTGRRDAAPTRRRGRLRYQGVTLRPWVVI